MAKIGEPELARRRDFRRTFGSESGRRVLRELLLKLHYFDETANFEESVLKNHAMWILTVLGVNEPHNTLRLVDKFFELPATAPGSEAEHTYDMLEEDT